jgi:hypothetical protein
MSYSKLHVGMGETRCGDIMDAAIIYPFYRLTPGPRVSPHA